MTACTPEGTLPLKGRAEDVRQGAPAILAMPTWLGANSRYRRDEVDSSSWVIQFVVSAVGDRHAGDRSRRDGRAALQSSIRP
jgi:hypothetical protein